MKTACLQLAVISGMHVILPSARYFRPTIDCAASACRCFEGALAALAAPLVGMLAEQMFGFSVSPSLTSAVRRAIVPSRGGWHQLMEHSVFTSQNATTQDCLLVHEQVERSSQ